MGCFLSMPASAAATNNIFDEEETFPLALTDADYAEQVQLDEVLMASLSFSTTTSLPISEAESYFHPYISESEERGKKIETGESSQSYRESWQMDCPICMDTKPDEEMFTINNTCTHSFCSDCIAQYVAAKIQDNVSTVLIKCPDLNCKEVLQPEVCRPIILLPQSVFDRWEDALCESTILGSQKFYCPFEDCSAMLVDDDVGGEIIVTESECPICHRLFCAQCKAPWHAGMECGAFQRLKEDEGRADAMFKKLEQLEKLKRCPNCKHGIEKSEGCLHMTCRCSFEFCYGCGSKWTRDHQCQRI